MQYAFIKKRKEKELYSYLSSSTTRFIFDIFIIII